MAWSLEPDDRFRARLSWREQDLVAERGRSLGLVLHLEQRVTERSAGRVWVEATIRKVEAKATHQFGLVMAYPDPSGRSPLLQPMGWIEGHSFSYRLRLATGEVDALQGAQALAKKLRKGVVPQDEISGVTLGLLLRFFQARFLTEGLDLLHHVLPGAGAWEGGWLIDEGRFSRRFRLDGERIRFQVEKKPKIRIVDDRPPQGLFLRMFLLIHTRGVTCRLGGAATFRAGRLRSSTVDQTLHASGRKLRSTRWSYEETR